jgi:MFS family permease
MEEWYGLLSGLAFTASFTTFGIFGGLAADKFNRKILLIIACVCWSICSLLTGLIDSFAGLFIFRFLLGFFQAVFNPCAYSIIADSIPKDYLATANSAFNAGIYFGFGLSSISFLLIKSMGWRFAYIIVGATGILIGLVGIWMIEEPKRNLMDLKRANLTFLER